MQVQVWLLGGANKFSDVFHVDNNVLIDLNLKSSHKAVEWSLFIKIKFQLCICMVHHLICWCMCGYIFFFRKKTYTSSQPTLIVYSWMAINTFSYFSHWHTLDNYSCFDRTSIFYYVPTHSKTRKQIYKRNI